MQQQQQQKNQTKKKKKKKKKKRLYIPSYGGGENLSMLMETAMRNKYLMIQLSS